MQTIKEVVLARLAKQGFGPAAVPCVHLGESTGETVGCPSCRGSVKLKLFACAIHGQCTTGKKVAGVACCPCAEYTE